MQYSSFAISFRIQLGFHAANNEGAGGTNVMEPRRITVGDKEYDGISGEIIRHHILENFVKLCQENKVPLHDRCTGLAPDRALKPLIELIENKNWQHTTKEDKQRRGIDPQNYPEATAEIIEKCALCDIGGFLCPLGESTAKVKVILGRDVGELGGSLKRDSCLEVGWLITEHPAVVNYTQHSAYDPSPEFHNLFVQNMRIGIYGGVLRVDLDRIGFNDWWWLQPGFSSYVLNDSLRNQRARLLLQAIRQWLLSPSFAKQAGWLHHSSGLLEGAIVLSKEAPAPFLSPIKFEIENRDPNKLTIKPNTEYRKLLTAIGQKCSETLEIYEFDNPAEFKDKMLQVEGKFPLQSESGK